MEILNNWTIVVGAATIISLILYWTKQAYLDPIINKEEEIIKKVKDDINTKMDKSKEIIAERGEVFFVDEIYDIIEFRKNLRDLKETFRGKMVPSGITVCFMLIGLVSVWNYNIFVTILIIYIEVLLLTILVGSFIKLRRYESEFSRYLEGEDPTKIFDK